MNLDMPLAPSANRRPVASRLSAGSNSDQATIYTRGGATLRVPLRPVPSASGGCAGHPASQLLRWLQRRAAAEPGFPVRVRSVLLVVGTTGGCASCQQGLERFLSRFYRGARLRLVKPGGHSVGCSCGCGHCQSAAAGPPRSVLDELLGETMTELEWEQWQQELEEEYRRFNRQFRRTMAQTIHQDPKHPLQFLVKDGKGGKPVWRTAKDRRVDAGHVTPVMTLSAQNRTKEHLAIQDRSLNRSDGAKMGATGKGTKIEVINIKGVPVDVETARKWVEQGLLPASYVSGRYIQDHKAKGWTADGELFYAVGLNKDLVSETGF
ncbi:polymorphic toxin type 5 domain-containing protein [Hymenobacter chitinivorans]|uniref:Putative RNase toxin 5 of polymorphic toxin system n=1 Tax=Hymenobacter chitinivorans DSM 11115 TaxID=1121954 RepID=A0A2M9BQD7_9BACT|nr:polymorphic toxin type 5 domain-containing protein [Hymenobacter chitinivorans]PJJ60173.1 putative RNase toxin 5 of polymorphic toxin system [Hymenobacter chitinivorans DSM 11115]